MRALSYYVRLENFEGPFDLLFHLIERAELDIYDIPIAKITGEYLDYIEDLEGVDLDSAGEFLLMAVRLLEIKSKLLLPKQQTDTEEEREDETDPRIELAQRLMEYKLFRDSVFFLQENAKERDLLFTRQSCTAEELFPEGRPLEGLTVLDLVRALQKVKKRLAPPTFPLGKNKKISVPKRIEELSEFFRKQQGECVFEELFAQDYSWVEAVATFLALLVLVERGKILIKQETVFGEIKIISVGEW